MNGSERQKTFGGWTEAHSNDWIIAFTPGVCDNLLVGYGRLTDGVIYVSVYHMTFGDPQRVGEFALRLVEP